MSTYIFKLPDLGEGTVEAEVVEWHVAIGDAVEEGDLIADVMTDKANVEVPAAVTGVVLRLGGEPGDVIAVGAELIAFETEAASTAEPPSPRLKPETAPAPVAKVDMVADAEVDGEAKTRSEAAPEPTQASTPTVHESARDPRRIRVATSPAIRKHAQEAGVDLAHVTGTGPGGRILRRDFQSYLDRSETPATPQTDAQAPQRAPITDEFTDNKVIGVRRVIAERMARSSREIPHFAYVEEVDVTELESLRQHLNDVHETKLTLLPFLGLALVRALEVQPNCNAHFDPDSRMLRQFHVVHLGIATQTDQGLKVPVIHGAQSLDLWALGRTIRSVTQAARDGTAKPADLSGSTITITSLGKMGGIASTPIINYPEVAIIGMNKAQPRPMVVGGGVGGQVGGRVEVRTIMNLSSSFDHRFVDGFDAASLIQTVKAALEHPATLWLGSPPK